MSRARLLADLLARPRTIAYGADRSQRADLYLPAGPGSHPVIVALHGGGWGPRYGKVLMKGLAGDLVRRGYAVWNVEYRRTGGKGGGYPQTLEDVATAIDHLAGLDAPLRLDDVVAVGHSAGGHLALWAAGRRDARVPLAAVVAQAGVADLSATARSPGMAREFMGGTPEELPERFRHADPMHRLPLGVPVLLVHGRIDATVPLRRSERFAAAAREAGDAVELLVIEDQAGDHRAHIDPDGEAWAAVVRWLQARRQGR